jgi:hypothetical protein|tara:strand:- start:565 stop:696 length:132 start_codon:yes stop_codon:yes gene_type:complete
MNNEPKKEEKKTPNLDENSGVLVEGFLEISDPETGEIILQRRD